MAELTKAQRELLSEIATRAQYVAPYTPGAVIDVAHPFIRETVSLFDGEGRSEVLTWRPGVRGENVLPDDSRMVADGIGVQHLTIVSVHKPGRFPARVFYTRRWTDPDGKQFGKGRCYVTTSQAFTRITRGYRHEYEMSDKAAGRAALKENHDADGR